MFKIIIIKALEIKNVSELTTEAKRSSEYLLCLVAITSWPVRKMNEPKTAKETSETSVLPYEEADQPW